ncbi:putative inner membrane protein YjeT (clustered with HflC) [Comamonas testosteroni]|nr:putative inner membrane protein YjeT (clustered with HflC) [Comamonas testosteroni]
MAMDWWESLGLAIAMLLVLEGLLPLFAPRAWRQLFAQLLQLRDGQLRFCGLLCIAAGAIMLVLL